MFLKIGSLGALVASIAMLPMWLWASLSSETLVRPISYSIADGQVTFTRETPHGPQVGLMHADITVTGTGLQCSQPPRDDVLIFQEAAGNSISFPVPDWMRPCVESGLPFYATIRLQVKWQDAVWLPAVWFTAKQAAPALPAGQVPAPRHRG